MLLKRIEKNGEIKAIYESSNILASKYNSKTNELTVIFKRGAQYKYDGVNESEYFKFEMADSQGKVLNTSIKSKTFEKLDDIDPKSIEAEIESYREDEIQMFEAAIIDQMKLIIHDTTNTGWDAKRLDKLVSMIDRYKEAVNLNKTETVSE